MAKIAKFKNEIWGYVTRNNPGLEEKLESAKELTVEIGKELDNAFVRYFKDQYVIGAEIKERIRA